MAQGDSDRVYRLGRMALLAERLRSRGPALVEILRAMQSGFSTGRPGDSGTSDRTGNAATANDPARRDLDHFDELGKEILVALEVLDGIREAWMSCPWCSHGWDEHKREEGKPSKCTHVDGDEELPCKCKPPASPGGEPGCSHHLRYRNADGTAMWRAVVHPKTNVKGNLKRKLRLCGWCYRHVRDFGHLPTRAEVEGERDGKRFGCLMGQKPAGKKAS